MSSSKGKASEDQGKVYRRIKPVFDHRRYCQGLALVYVQGGYTVLGDGRSEITRSELDLDNSSERIMCFPSFSKQC